MFLRKSVSQVVRVSMANDMAADRQDASPIRVGEGVCQSVTLRHWQRFKFQV